MEQTIKLGRFRGIPVGLHWSWFIIFAVITWSLVGTFLYIEKPGFTASTAWTAAIVTSLLFFLSVLVHEFGHAVFALRSGIPVRSINLFIFGGVAQIGQEPETPGVEFRIAIAGPIASLLLGVLFYAIHLLFRDIQSIGSPALWLSRINLLMAGFNMIPGFPLDGGRVFRAILWNYSKSFSKANRVAATGGQVVALCFIVSGIGAIVTGNYFSGLWIAFIGWYLNSAAASSYTAVKFTPVLNDVKASQVMQVVPNAVPASMTLQQVITEYFIPHGIDLFTITDAGKPIGVLTMQAAAAVPRADWQTTLLRTVMVPMEKITRISPDTNIQSVLQTMDRRNLSHVTVHDGSGYAGIVTKEQIQRYAHLVSDLGV
jgi:Zn-dependent protease